jgi:hypothetical protein
MLRGWSLQRCAEAACLSGAAAVQVRQLCRLLCCAAVHDSPAASIVHVACCITGSCILNDTHHVGFGLGIELLPQAVPLLLGDLCYCLLLVTTHNYYVLALNEMAAFGVVGPGAWC